ncbi:hypothetical protein [Nonomuraea dietziae]|uniref:hypothetical protein n=1 Tax=Nonomuraea dietziae TaxID=65515 RepID=UPI00343BEEE0
MSEQGLTSSGEYRVAGVGGNDGEPRGQPLAVGVSHGEGLGGDDQLNRVVGVQAIPADRPAVQHEAGSKDTPAAPRMRHHTVLDRHTSHDPGRVFAVTRPAPCLRMRAGGLLDGPGGSHTAGRRRAIAGRAA